MRISETTLTTNLTAVTNRQNSSTINGNKMKNHISKNRRYALIIALFFWSNLSFASFISDTTFVMQSVKTECIGTSESGKFDSIFNHCSSTITVISSSRNIEPKFKIAPPNNIIGDQYKLILPQRIKKPPRFPLNPVSTSENGVSQYWSSELVGFHPPQLSQML